VPEPKELMGLSVLAAPGRAAPAILQVFPKLASSQNGDGGSDDDVRRNCLLCFTGLL
jgi:hypothetical protein